MLSFLYSSPIYSVYRRKTLMSIKLVHIKRVYELLSSRPRDQTHITSISCTGRQSIYWPCRLGIDTHFKNHCHQLLLFMTEVGERTLEEVPISILFSQGTVVMLDTPVITGTSQFLQWWSVYLKNSYKFMGCDVSMINVFILSYCFR